MSNKKFKISEVPTIFTEREKGVSKLNLKGAGLRFFNKVLRLKK